MLLTPAISARVHPDLRAFAYQEAPAAMEHKKANQQWNRMVRPNIVTSSVFSQHLPVLERDHGGATVDAPIIPNDIKESATGFGSLGSLLQAISAVYANHEVSPRLPTWKRALIDHPVGIVRR